MSLWRHLRHGLRVLTNRRAADQDIADEIEHYLEQATANHLARGLSSKEALRAARLELGSPVSVREHVRAYGWENLVDIGFADVRYAIQRLRRAPGFSAIAILTLALGNRCDDGDLQCGETDPARAAAVFRARIGSR